MGSIRLDPLLINSAVISPLPDARARRRTVGIDRVGVVVAVADRGADPVEFQVIVIVAGPELNLTVVVSLPAVVEAVRGVEPRPEETVVVGPPLRIVSCLW